MSYNFKNLGNVDLLDTMPEEANILVEVDGSTRRAPQVDEISKLVNSEQLEEVPEGATVLAEVNGAIKRVPGAGLGGVKTAFFRIASDGDGSVITCDNMSFEEAFQILSNLEPLNFMVLDTTDYNTWCYGKWIYINDDAIHFTDTNGHDCYWDSTELVFNMD